ncbi:MAG: hypothetical protein R3C05_16715 [Pirellulaceae bacterium]
MYGTIGAGTFRQRSRWQSNVYGKEDNSLALFRHATLEDAWNAVQASQRPMLLYATSNHCGYCTKMLKKTFSQTPITEGVSQYTEPVTFNGSEFPEIASVGNSRLPNHIDHLAR